MSQYTDPGSVMDRLAEISGYLQTKAPEIERAIFNYHKRRAALELEMAKARRVLKGIDSLTVPDKQARIIQFVEEEREGLFSKVAELEGCVEGAKMAFKVLDREASNLQSLLQQFRAEGHFQEKVPYA